MRRFMNGAAHKTCGFVSAYERKYKYKLTHNTHTHIQPRRNWSQNGLRREFGIVYIETRVAGRVASQFSPSDDESELGLAFTRPSRLTVWNEEQN